MATREVRVDLTGTREYRDLLAKLAATKAVLAERERELREIKGYCTTMACRLHYAHSGPCDIPGEEA
jgi:hypothetical protein